MARQGGSLPEAAAPRSAGWTMSDVAQLVKMNMHLLGGACGKAGTRSDRAGDSCVRRGATQAAVLACSAVEEETVREAAVRERGIASPAQRVAAARTARWAILAGPHALLFEFCAERCAERCWLAHADELARRARERRRGRVGETSCTVVGRDAWEVIQRRERGWTRRCEAEAGSRCACHTDARTAGRAPMLGVLSLYE